MSNTPRTDANYIRGFEALMSRTADEDEWVPADFARQLERELAEARQTIIMMDARTDSMRIWAGQSYTWHPPAAREIHDLAQKWLEANRE